MDFLREGAKFGKILNDRNLNDGNAYILAWGIYTETVDRALLQKLALEILALTNPHLE